MDNYEIIDIKTIFNTPQILDVFSTCMYMPTEAKLNERAAVYMNDDKCFIFGYRTTDGIISVAVFHLASNDVAELQGIATADEYRNTGAGRSLITHAMKSLALSDIYAETDDDAVGFYKNCGFEIEDLGFKYENHRRYKCTLRKTAANTDIGIFSWFGFSIPMLERAKLIHETGYKSVMLWWADDHKETDGPKEKHPEICHSEGLGIVNIHTPSADANHL